MGMVGLRDVLMVAPAAYHHPFHPHHQHDSSVLHSTDNQNQQQQPIIPLFTSAPFVVDDHTRNAAGAGIHFWQQNSPPNSNQQQQQQINPLNPNLRKPLPVAASMSLPVGLVSTACTGIFNADFGASGGSTIAFGGGGGSGTGTGIVLPSSSSATTCQDCGNQAKKDCSHRRCRTCCKGRGLECSTHVKSTWVPAARRRERQQLSAALAAAAGSSASTSGSKKPRLIASASNTTASHTSTSGNTPPLSFDTTSCHQDASFMESLPRNVRAPATFKCVKVTSIDDGEDEYAYQAVVKIGGHVFKGFLYDQGTGEEGDDADDDDNNNINNNGSNCCNNNNNSCNIPNFSELHLGAGGKSVGGPGSSSSPMLLGVSHSDPYAGSGGVTAYGNP